MSFIIFDRPVRFMITRKFEGFSILVHLAFWNVPLIPLFLDLLFADGMSGRLNRPMGDNSLLPFGP